MASPSHTESPVTDPIAALSQDGVRVIRLSYPDLHGVARGKDIAATEFDRVADGGVPHCEAIMTVDLRHNVVGGDEHGFQDIVARLDPATLVRLPWNPAVAWGIADLEVNVSREPYEADSRHAVRRAVAALEELRLSPVVGPELEFYLCERDPSTPSGWRRHVDHDSQVYTVGEVADPAGLLFEMLNASVDLGLGAFAANHEYGRGQFEINLGHSPALDAADRAFRFKVAVKEMAARRGMMATFIGKPWNDDEGSGFHLHLSLADPEGGNAFADPGADHGLSDHARHFAAGVLAHAPALMAFLNPTVNAYKRLTPESLAPTNANWGYDNRLALLRVPQERGRATRLEIRVADGAANVHLAVAATLFAGLDGLRRGLEPPAPVSGNPHLLPEDEQGPPLPASLDESLAALDADPLLREAMGAKLVDTFLTIKRAELARWKTYVTEWEFREYARHL